MRTSDFLIIGAGIIGINLALQLRKRYPNCSIIVLEKERRLGEHSSGRNSGVLHAGFYYTADSLKARFTRDGNRILKEYIRRKGLKLNECGKLVVAKNEEELKFIDELMARGKRNGVELEKIDEKQAREIEPRVKTHEYAIYSPSTATADPLEVIKAFRDDALAAGVSIEMHQIIKKIEGNRVETEKATFEGGYVINAAGLYADQIAHRFGYGEGYAILPFKGLSLRSNEPAGAFRTNIYPVPDLRNPFLGVHVTVTVDGKGKIGPTAIPAFWKEQYGGLKNFRFKELAEIVWRGSQLMIYSDFNFRKLAFEEFMKYNRHHLVELSTSLADSIRTENYKQWGQPGIRAQLLNLNSRQLVMDFYYEGDDRSFHVLNAVSPGWTCAIPFCEHMVCKIDELINKSAIQNFRQKP